MAEDHEVDWNAIMTHIEFKLRMALARHPEVGKALTMQDGDKLVTDLASSLTYEIHRQVDPTYDPQ